MKNLDFKRQENAELRYIEEQVRGKRMSRFNWDRIVYLTILALLVFFVFRYFFFHSFYITAKGQVIFDNVNISSTDDMQIERFNFEEGSNVKVGDTLFMYTIQDPNAYPWEGLLTNRGDKSTWTDRELYSLQKSIDLNTSKIKGNLLLLNSYKSRLKQMENVVILGAVSERDINNLNYQISRLVTNIELTKSENEVLKKQLNALKLKEETFSELEALEMSEFSPYRAFISPIDGYIAQIYMEPHEIAFKSQIVLKIHQADSVFIKGYFDQEDLRYVKEGNLVSVAFPDGSESEGVIHRFYSSTVLIPEEFQKKYEPAKRTIAVDIVPAAGSDLNIWKRYYKLSVKLTKRTF